MRVRAAASLLVTGLTIAACAQKPVPVAPPPAEPDPFGYRKVSAVCQVGPITTLPDGSLAATMKVRSDDGLCAVSVQQKSGGAYASFLLTTLPDHGKVSIHNYNGQTLIDYTATTAYAGPDKFGVTLVPSADGARTVLAVSVAVDNTGVTLPPAPVVPAAPPPATTSHHTTRHTTHHVEHRKSSSGN